jgi:hypothetical protein
LLLIIPVKVFNQYGQKGPVAGPVAGAFEEAPSRIYAIAGLIAPFLAGHSAVPLLGPHSAPRLVTSPRLAVVVMVFLVLPLAVVLKVFFVVRLAVVVVLFFVPRLAVVMAFFLVVYLAVVVMVIFFVVCRAMAAVFFLAVE